VRVDEIGLLEGLLQAYSPTYQEAAAVDYLVGQMREMGFSAAVDGAGNAVGTRGEGERELLLLGHIDTVPGQIPVRREGDRLYGRGSVDAKGPLACFTAAAARVSPPPGWRVTVVGALAEEGDSRGARFLKDRRPPQALIIGEPSKWDKITLGFKGSVWADYTLRRQVAHTAGRAESVCEAAVCYWNEIVAWCTGLNADIPAVFSQLTPTLRGMGSETDGFTDTAWLKLNLRLPPRIGVAQVIERLEAQRGDGVLEFGDAIEAYRAEKNTPLVRAFLGAIRGEGGDPAFTVKTGTSDMNLVAPGWGCQTVAYGPGDSNLDHTPGEHVSLEEYQKSIRVLARVLEQFWNNE
jgi:[amino group carrier protein]-lysine/ornithine hydrolase